MRAKNVAAIAVTLVIADILDLWTTYLATPDLSKELNPLVTGFGLGWGAVCFVHFVILIVLVLGLDFFYRNEPRARDLPPGATSALPAFVWYLTGSTASRGKARPNNYIVFLCLFVPLGAIFNALANSALNITYHLGWHGGLDPSTFGLFNLAKLVLLFCVLGAFFYVYLRINYLGKRSQ